MLKLRMRNGNSNLLLLLTCALAMFASPALALDLDAVLDRTTITPPSRVGFREVRHNRMLKDELIITGYLEYLQKGSLLKVVEAPFEEAYLIRSDSIEIERGGVTTTLSLRKSRVLSTMLGGIEAILAGETEELLSVFDYELSGVEEDWSLQLLPRSKRIAKQLSRLTVTGDCQSVTAIRFDLKDGEWHKLEIIHKPDRQ
jgi:hypothetical protein